jgi:hypoxanthine phosphoribosyltransferase
MEHLDDLLDIGQIILNQDDISTRLLILAEDIANAYSDSEHVDVIVLLNGAKRFADNLFAIIDDPKFSLQYLRAKSYNGTVSNGKVQAEKSIRNILDSDVLVIDDIYDTGRTLEHITEMIRMKEPRSIKICVLLEKMIEHCGKVSIDFKGFDVPESFLIGYGLDYNGQFRELPFIAAYEPEK